jgi:hypothetical protein
LQKSRAAHVAFGSKATFSARLADVRFAPESDRLLPALAALLQT